MSASVAVPALTTTFTPAASCLSNTFQVNATIQTTDSNGVVVTYGFLQVGPPPSTDCYPSSYSSTMNYYSPGICPHGYTQACSSLINIGSLTETRATCCPAGFSCQGSTSPTAPYPWYLTEVCTSALNSDVPKTIYSVLAAGTTTSYTTTLLHGGGPNAYGISIRYQVSDFASKTSSSSSVSQTSANPASAATSDAASNPTSTSLSKLSSGAIAGIAVGVVAVFALLAFVVCYIRRSKQRTGRGAAVMHEKDEAHVTQEMEALRGAELEDTPAAAEVEGVVYPGPYPPHIVRSINKAPQELES